MRLIHNSIRTSKSKHAEIMCVELVGKGASTLRLSGAKIRNMVIAFNSCENEFTLHSLFS